MQKHKKILVFILCSISVHALILTGCDAWPASSKKTTAISSAEEPSSEEGDTAQSAETDSADKKAGRAAGTKLAYKEVSRAPGTDSVDEKIRTAADVETRADVEATAREDAVNLEILEQMTALNEKGEFSEAIKATEGMNKNGDSAPKIIALRNEIIRGNKDYFETQLAAAFKNGDLYMIKVLSNFFDLNREQKREYNFVQKLQGEYVPYDDQSSGVSVIISGYEIQVNGTVDRFSYKIVNPLPELEYFDSRLALEHGGEVEEVCAGLISINQENGTYKKYLSTASREYQENNSKRVGGGRKQSTAYS